MSDCCLQMTKGTIFTKEHRQIKSLGSSQGAKTSSEPVVKAALNLFVCKFMKRHEKTQAPHLCSHGWFFFVL